MSQYQSERPSITPRRSSVRFETPDTHEIVAPELGSFQGVSEETLVSTPAPSSSIPVFNNHWNNSPISPGQSTSMNRPRLSIGSTHSGLPIASPTSATHPIQAPRLAHLHGNNTKLSGFESLPRYDPYRESLPSRRMRAESQPQPPKVDAGSFSTTNDPSTLEAASPVNRKLRSGLSRFVSKFSGNYDQDEDEEEKNKGKDKDKPKKKKLVEVTEEKETVYSDDDRHVRTRRTRAMSEGNLSITGHKRPPYSRSETDRSDWDDDEEDDDDENFFELDDDRVHQKITYDKHGNRIVTKIKEVREHASSHRENVRFIAGFAKALLSFGAPSHRIEALLSSLSRELEVKAQFTQFPGVIIAVFGDPQTKGSNVRFIKATGGVDLGRAHKAHCVYRDLMHDTLSAKEGAKKIERLMNAPPLYGSRLRIFYAFGCAAAICPLAFGGSFADMWVAGILSCSMAFVNIKYASKNSVLINIFELVMAVLVSLVARAVSFINNGEIFCYQAVASGGVVLILPGFLILLSSLDLANKHMLTGSIKLVYTITYTLFLAFCLTLGSDLFFLGDSSARQQADRQTSALAAVETISGSFSAMGPTATAVAATASATLSAATSAATSAAVPANWTGSFTFSNSSAVASYSGKIINGCLRDPSWSWYAQPVPSWTLFILVPVFSILISLNNMQPLFSWHFLAMVVISIASFAANKFANKFAFSQTAIVTTVGAFVVGLCGNVYSRVFRGSGFTVSVTGVLFLVPSGLSAAGGLADTYRGTNNDYFSASLQVASRMIQVGIGITIGLLFSGLAVYLFGKKKRTAVFAF